MTLFWLVFLVCGLLGVMMGGTLIVMGLASRRWPKVQGRIESSEIETTYRQSHDSTSYAPSIAYSYSVGDKVYWGHQVSAGDHGGSRAHAEKIVAKYFSGLAVEVSYDPEDPQLSLLEPGFAPAGLWILLMGAVFTTAAILGFLGIIGK